MQRFKTFFLFVACLLVIVGGVDLLVEKPITTTVSAKEIEHQLPVAKSGVIREVTAYTSEVGQTDDTPCISADGSNICSRYAKGESICASNFVPLGTRLSISGYGTCVVADRMARKHGQRVDVYFGNDTPEALKFGKKHLFVRAL